MNPGTSIETASSRTQFYQSHLDRVSRSFAFCIARLEQPLRDQVSLGYLLCRLLDTIEDAKWNALDEQIAGFENFDSFLKTRPREADVKAWAARVPEAIPEGERLLLNEAFEVFASFHDLESSIREALAKPIESMSAGMRHYQERGAREDGLRLVDLDDVNQYCFFVAGVVGEMLANLALSKPSKQTLGDAFWFGLFLQKINLLKDQKGDEAVGRFLVPERPLLRTSLLGDAERAFSFLKSLPLDFEGFRLFCGWSLFLGLASLPFIDRGEKIPRERTWEVLAEVETAILNNEALETLFNSLVSPLEVSAPNAVSRVSKRVSNLRSLYRGHLRTEDLDQIFPLRTSIR